MKKFYKNWFRHTLIYWANPIPDGYGGNAFDNPMVLKCRWESRSELYINDANEQVISNAIVYLDREISVGEFVMKGDYDDLDSTHEMPDDKFAYRVNKIDISESRSGKNKLFKIWL